MLNLYVHKKDIQVQNDILNLNQILEHNLQERGD
jgi:hypothetical protein